MNINTQDVFFTLHAINSTIKKVVSHSVVFHDCLPPTSY